MKIVCVSKPKEPYKPVILELSKRAGVEVKFVKKARIENAIVLDEKGDKLTFEKLKELVKSDPVFVVGGPDGTESTGKRFSLGNYTLNHQIAIIVLLDLLFRAKNPNHPYNKH